jgi:hypothetical protein
LTVRYAPAVLKMCTLTGVPGDPAVLVIYGDSSSGNCLKVKWISDHLGLACRGVETCLLAAEARTPELPTRIPAVEVPS